MKTILTTYIFLLVGLLNVNAQSDVSGMVENINSIISEISTDKTIYNQRVELKDADLSIAEIIIEEENIKKGNTTTSRYLLNMAFLNKAKIERKIKKTEMALVLNCSQGDYILLTEEDNKTKYVNSVKLMCSDIDVLRDLEQVFQNLVEQSSKSWDVYVASYATSDLTGKIKNKVANIQYSDNNSFEQSFDFSSESKDKVTYKLDYSNGKKSESMQYDFSLGTIAASQLKVDTKGDQVYCTIKADDKAKKISVLEEGETAFVNNVKLYFDSPTNAILFKSLLEKSIEEFGPDYLARIESHTNCANCVEDLNAIISNVNNNTIKIDGGCDTKISMTEKDKTKSYNFNWGDVLPSSVKIKFNGKEQDISFQTNSKMKYIGVYEEGELQKYDSKFSLESSDIDASEFIAALIPETAKKCEQTFEPISFTNLMEEVSSNVIEDRYEQSLEKEDDKECSYLFKSLDMEKGKSSEIKFNLYDVDENALKVTVSGKEIALELGSKAKEKVFTKHDEKGKLEYVSKYEMRFADVKAVRVALETFKSEIKSCK